MLKLKRMRVVLAILFIFLPLSFSQAEDLVKQQARDYREKGYRLQSRGDVGGALPFYQKAIKLDPEYVQAYNDLGVAYEMRGRLNKAKRYYQKALEINSKFLPAHANLALLYEKQNNIEKATYHWKERYINGKKGEYWQEVARQHLLKLGTYPEVREEMIEKKAANLSKDISYQREQERLEAIEEAKLHFKLGKRAFEEGSYEDAIEELSKVISLAPKAPELKEKAKKIMEKSKSFHLRQSALVDTKDALEYIENNDYLSAADRLKSALNSVFRITQKDVSQIR
ncbi:MAG: tetratricopeptide repeat protein [Candidatus Omnitrophica bacterium]|nr:tetratricopeptide repeat protein [Candidatus Omnitrophota bacterium]MCF7893971.1 tetratricopeptide repeat protein [Candidatus Omnitrophota bacterium]